MCDCNERISAMERAICELEKNLQILQDEVDHTHVEFRRELERVRRTAAPPWAKSAGQLSVKR